MKLTKIVGTLVPAVIAVTAIALDASEVRAQYFSEDAFIVEVANSLDRGGVGYLNNFLSTHSVFSLGYSVCNGLDSGLSISNILQVMEGAAATSDLSNAAQNDLAYSQGVVARSALTYLCPRHYAYMQNFLTAVQSAQSTSSTYYAPRESNTPGWVFLRADDAQARINIREQPSVDAISRHYGVVGDRVWASRTTISEGHTWYFVGFPESGATGWVRGDLIAQ